MRSIRSSVVDKNASDLTANWINKPNNATPILGIIESHISDFRLSQNYLYPSENIMNTEFKIRQADKTQL